MKLIAIAVAALLLVGCSTAPTKLERIEANEAAISALNARVHKNTNNIEANRKANADTDVKIDRMFEKSQYK